MLLSPHFVVNAADLERAPDTGGHGKAMHCGVEIRGGSGQAGRRQACNGDRSACDCRLTDGADPKTADSRQLFNGLARSPRTRIDARHEIRILTAGLLEDTHYGY